MDETIEVQYSTAGHNARGSQGTCVPCSSNVKTALSRTFLATITWKIHTVKLGSEVEWLSVPSHNHIHNFVQPPGLLEASSSDHQD